MKKVIFIDVDGTLKNDNNEITPRTLKAIQEVKSIGYEPILCTGRPRDYAEKLNSSIGGSRYIIYNNGGGIFDCQENKVIYENGMNNKSISELYELANLKDIRFILACDGTRYVNRLKHHDGSEILIEKTLNEFLKDHKVIQVTITSSNYELLKDMKHKIEDVSDVRIMNQHKSLIDLNFEKIGTIYYDIVDDKTSKGDAVSYFCQLFDISKENRIAIGDDNNDISMFNECGYRVAMKNALISLKELSDYITNDNNNDGVAEYLEKIIKESKNA